MAATFPAGTTPDDKGPSFQLTEEQLAAPLDLPSWKPFEVQVVPEGEKKPKSKETIDSNSDEESTRHSTKPPNRKTSKGVDRPRDNDDDTSDGDGDEDGARHGQHQATGSNPADKSVDVDEELSTPEEELLVEDPPRASEGDRAKTSEDFTPVAGSGDDSRAIDEPQVEEEEPATRRRGPGTTASAVAPVRPRVNQLPAEPELEANRSAPTGPKKHKRSPGSGSGRSAISASGHPQLTAYRLLSLHLQHKNKATAGSDPN